MGQFFDMFFQARGKSKSLIVKIFVYNSSCKQHFFSLILSYFHSVSIGSILSCLEDAIKYKENKRSEKEAEKELLT